MSTHNIDQRAGDHSNQFGTVYGNVYQNLGRPPRYSAPFQSPPLPAHFVPRPEASNALKALLLNEEAATPGVLVVSAIHGLGGIGKSTLAMALAHDPKVQERFPDGILWASLGQGPDILSLLGGWVQALGDYDFRPTTVDGVSAHLRTLLRDKAVLLIVDDVWNPSHTQPFRVNGAKGHIIITTRRADVADEVGTKPYELDVMTRDQSLTLLSARVGRSIAEPEQDEALQVVEAVGYLPLALELAARRVARGISWATLSKDLQEETSRLAALSDPRHRLSTGATQLEASLNLSLNALRADSEVAWQAFVWLAILPEDAQFAAPMASTLWGITEVEASNRLELLWNDALLLRGPLIQLEKRHYPTYRLHDLLRDVARKLMTEPTPQGLGLRFEAAHATFLERHQALIHEGSLHTLPVDGYIHARLTWHMEQANQCEEIHALLKEKTEDGQNGWYVVREKMGEGTGYLADVKRAWQLAEKEFSSSQSALSIALQCRYALTVASLNSLAQNLPLGLIKTLVMKGVWLASQALAYALQIPDSGQRSKALIELCPFFNAAQMPSAIEAAEGIENTHHKAETLGKLAIRTAELGHPEKAVSIVQRINDNDDRVTEVAVLARRLAELHYPKEALVMELAALAPFIPEPLKGAPLWEMLIAARPTKIADNYTVARINLIRRSFEAVQQRLSGYFKPYPRGAELTSQPSESLLLRVIVAARELENASFPQESCARLAIRLAGLNYPNRALNIARGIQNEHLRREALTRLAFRLAEAGFPKEAVEIAREIHRETATSAASGAQTTSLVVDSKHGGAEQDRGRIQGGELASRLAELGHLEEALAAARMVRTVDDRARILSEVASRLAELGRLEEALAAAREIKRTSIRADVLSQLASILSEPLLHNVLQVARGIQDIDEWVMAFAELVPFLSEPLRGEALQDILTGLPLIEDERQRAEVLIRVVLQLPAPLMLRALAVTREIENKDHQAEALSMLIPRLAELGYVKEALEATQDIQIPWRRVLVLAELCPMLSQPLKGEALRDALELLQGIESEWWRAEALMELFPHITKPLLPRVLAAVCEIRIEDLRVKVFSKLALWVARLLTPGDALAVIQEIKNKDDQARVLGELIPYVAELGDGGTALFWAQEIEIEEYRARALLELTFRLTELGRPDEALTSAQKIPILWWRGMAMAELASKLRGVLKDEALRSGITAAREIQDTSQRATLLTGLIFLLEEPLKTQIVREALAAARNIQNESQKIKSLAGLFPWLRESLQSEILKDIMYPKIWTTQ